MRSLVALSILISCSLSELQAQQHDNLPDTIKKQIESGDAMFTLIEESATFPGGIPAFYKYVSENISFPKKAKREGVKGRVYVEFVIRQDGSIDPEAVRCPSQQELASFQLPTADMIDRPDCQEEAMRLIRKSPDWIPGKQKNKTVKQRMTVPIFFR